MLTVFYRMAGIASTNPSPIYQEDKLKLNELCLKSFVEAYRYVHPKVIFLCDYCSPEHEQMIRQVCSFPQEIYFTEIGINETCLMQYDMASKLEGPILFQECDYVYRPDTGEAMVAGIEALGLCSPYDHPNFYKARDLHSETCDIQLVGSTHWRTTERNTMTFGLMADVLKDNLDIFNKYGYLDGDVWYELRDRGVNLHVPIPSFATHMAKDYLAPSVDWEELWRIRI